MDLEVHPLVKGLFPPMAAEDFRALCRDIRANGLHEPIWLYEGMIVDGDNRNQACQIENITARFERYEGPDPVGFAVSKNLHRRHLTVADRKRIAARLLKQNPTLTDSEVAKRAGLGSHNTAARVRAQVKAEAAPANGQDDNKDGSSGQGSSPEPAPHIIGEGKPTADASPPTPAPRVESTGRRARGRKPGTAVEQKKAVKPKPAGASPREQWLMAAGTLCKADPEQLGEDLTIIFVDCGGRLRDKVKEWKRRTWLQEISEALGFPWHERHSGA